MNKQEILSRYYQNELNYIRSSGREFAKKYPKIASKLDLAAGEANNSQVERMIESFAFLCGKLQMQIDDCAPELAQELIQVIYPPLAQQTPSTVLISFDIDTSRCIKLAGTVVKRHTQLVARSNTANPIDIYFSTCSDLALWPLSVEHISVISKDDLDNNYIDSGIIYYLKIDLHWYGTKQTPTPSEIKFFINGDSVFKEELFAALFLNNGFCLCRSGDSLYRLKPIMPIGIRAEESLFPYSDSAFSGFRLLHEYFAFPDKFMGFSIAFEDVIFQEGLSIYIPLGKKVELPADSQNTLLLHTVPAVNLFKKVTEPLKLTHEQMYYDLIPDSRRLSSTEIYSINCVYGADQFSNEKSVVPYFFSKLNRNFDTWSSCNKPEGIFWHYKREKMHGLGNRGENVKIAFIDHNFDYQAPATQIFWADTLCTNRHLAEEISAKTLFQTDQSFPVKKIYCVDRPTVQKDPIRHGTFLWQMISMYSLNSMSIYSNGAEKLKTILDTFAGYNSDLATLSIKNLECCRITKLIRNAEWRGPQRGTQITVDFEAALSNMGIPLSMILSNFFAVYTTINTYTELKTSINGQVIKTWPIQTGLQNYL